MNKTLLFLWLSASSFIATVAICIILQPADILAHSGLSFYGNFQRTILPYGLGLVMTAYFLLRACYLLKNQVARSFRLGLEAVAVGLLGIVATPSFSSFKVIQDLHVLFGLLIFTTLAGLSLHYLIHVEGKLFDWILLVLQFVAIVIVALSFHAVGILSLMLPAQVLDIGSFGTLLIRAASYRAHMHSASSSPR